MNARKLLGSRLGHWVFGSAVGWGCVAPLSGVADVLGGVCASWPCCCQVATETACTGASCTGGTFCECNQNNPDGNGVCQIISGFACPIGCDNGQFGMRCVGGDMSPCYYPP